MKKLLLALLAIVLLTSCSMVFDAGVSGELTDKDTKVGIEDVKVYVYTSKSSRDADYNAKNPRSYINMAVTNAEGRFLIDKIVWETNKSAFGKDADKIDLYFLFDHELYGTNGSYFVNSIPIRIFSESSNSSSYSEDFDKTYKEINVVFNLINVADDTTVLEAYDLDVSSDDPNLRKQIDEDSYIISSLVKEVEIDYTYSIVNDRFIVCDENGLVTLDSANNPMKDASITDVSVKDGKAIDLYVKQVEFDYPSVRGRISGSGISNPTSYEVGLYLGSELLASQVVETAVQNDAGTIHAATFNLVPNKNFTVDVITSGKITDYKNETLTIKVTGCSDQTIDLTGEPTTKTSFIKNFTI